MIRARIPSVPRIARGIGIGIAVAAVVGGACVPRDAGIADLSAVVSQRFGSPVSVQSRQAHDDGSTPAEVQNLLRHPLDAGSAARIALLNNRDFRASLSDLGIAASAIFASGALPNPTFGFSYQVPLTGRLPALIDFEALIDVQGMLLVASRRGAANEDMRATRFDVAARALDLAFDAEVELHRFVAARQLVEMRRTALTAAAASLDAARLLFEAGNIGELDRSEQEALYQDARLELVEAESDLAQQREQVNIALGLWGRDASWEAPERLADAPADEPDLLQLEQRAIERSLRLLALRHRIGADRGRLTIAQALGWLPQLEAGVAVAQHEGVIFAGPSVRLALPLFNQGQGAVGTRAAELHRDEATLEAEAVRVRASIRAAQAQLTFARSRARFYHDVQLPLRQRIVENAERQYNAMQLGVFQFLQARREQIEAGRAYVASLRDYWIARATVARILSGGSAEVSSNASMADGRDAMRSSSSGRTGTQEVAR